MSVASTEQARLRRLLAMKACHVDAMQVHRHGPGVGLGNDEERVAELGLVRHKRQAAPLTRLGHRGLEPREIGREERWRDAATKVVVMMRRHTAPAHAKGGEGLNLCICMVLLTLERRLGMGGEGLNPLQCQKAHTWW